MNKKRFFGIMIILGVLCLFVVIVNKSAEAQNQPVNSPDAPDAISITAEIAGQIGGGSYAVDWQNNYVYVGIGPRLHILDVTDPTHPIIVGKSQVLPNKIDDLAIEGSYVYIAYFKKLIIIDISNPTKPIPIGFYDSPNYIGRISVAGKYAYLTHDVYGFSIIDISNPTMPLLAGLYTGPGYISDIKIMGDYAYIADWEGLRIVDISNPAAPITTGVSQLANHGYKVEVAGDYAYIANMYKGLYIIDVSNPYAPLEVGLYGSINAYNVVVRGNYAYISYYATLDSEEFSGLLIVNISNPANPTYIGDCDTESGSDIVLGGDYVYMASWDSGLHIIEISNPQIPTEAGSYDAVNAANHVEVGGNYAYIADQVAGLRIYDISDPTDPIEIGHIETGGNASSLALSGQYVYVRGGFLSGSGALYIIDISNPTLPVIAGTFNNIGPSNGDDDVVGDYAYVADGNYGLRIINVSNPAAPVETGSLKMDAQDLVVAGGYAFVLDYREGMHIINISNPAAPSEVGFYDVPYVPKDVTVAGKYVYVTLFEGISPLQENSVLREHAKASEDDSGLLIIDVSDPANPIEAGYFDPPVWAQYVALAGNYAYIIDGDNILYIVDISNPTNPIEVGLFHSRWAWGVDVYVRGNYVYIADEAENGLMILRLLTDKVIASIPTTGGILTSTNGAVNMMFPSGAFTETVNVTYRQLLYDEHVGYWAGIDHAFDISAVYSDTEETANLAPDQKFTITMTYAESETNPAFEDTLALYSRNDIAWVREPSSILDPVSNTLIATPNHLSLWAILGDVNRVFMPFSYR
jgi:hypothetical protein